MAKVPPAEVAERIVALQALLAKSGTDVAVIRQNADLYYFTGTVQDAHLIVPAEGEPILLVRRDRGPRCPRPRNRLRRPGTIQEHS